MKNLSNRYFYEVHYYVDDNGNIHRRNGDVYADRKNRLYKTKMKPNDLPEYYCEVQLLYLQLIVFQLILF